MQHDGERGDARQPRQLRLLDPRVGCGFNRFGKDFVKQRKNYEGQDERTPSVQLQQVYDFAHVGLIYPSIVARP